LVGDGTHQDATQPKHSAPGQPLDDVCSGRQGCGKPVGVYE
jgi:hypothetical protein